MNQLALVQDTGRMQRKMRRPTHNYYLEHRPYQIQPFMIAPVLPGETLKNLNMQGRAITDPLANGPLNIMPWWHETYFFYVKLRDLDARDALEAMLLKGTTIAGLNSAAQAETYHQGGAPNWTAMCLKRVTEEYFRNEGEVWDAQKLGNLPIASAIQHGTNWADSLIVDGAMPTNNILQTDREDDVLPAYAEAYERMTAMRMVDMSFEEWLGTFGIRGPKAIEKNKPELIRYAKNWTYPTNTVEPTTGVPSAAVSWSVNERADKDRFFDEPGFIFGVTVVRAKLYMGNQRGAAVSMLEDAYVWLNAMMRDQPETSVKEFVGPTTPTGPLRGQTANYWVDVRDLFIYGDQYIGKGTADLPQNFAPALPAANGEKRYPTSAMVDALYLVGTANKVRQEGVVSLNIASHATTATDNTGRPS